MNISLNLFYHDNPNRDRWIPYDRYPRAVVRRLYRGKRQILGQERVFINLCAGLDKIGQEYRINDYDYALKNPNELVGIVGKPHLLDAVEWKNPIVFGAAVFSHPTEDPNLLTRLPVKRVLVPGEWYRKMFEPIYGNKVFGWPVGIDTEKWHPTPAPKEFDILVYDKIRWEHDRYEKEFIMPILATLRQENLKVAYIRYGFYREEMFSDLLRRSNTMLFLCEHESQGIAYQQAMSCNVPILAWDRGGYWQDPSYYPKIKFGPVTSVPGWDERCGIKFKDLAEFSYKLEEFFDLFNQNKFSPRDYIMENLTLEICAQRYVDLVNEVQNA